MAGGSGRGRGRRDVEEDKRSQIMQNIFGDQFDEEVEEEEEEEADGHDEGDSGPNGGDRGRGSRSQQQSRLFLFPAEAEDEYESDNGHGGDQWEEGQGESQGSGGMAQEIEVESHHVELCNQRMQGHRKGVNTAEGGYVKITSKTSRSIEDEKDHEVVCDVFGDSDQDGLAPYRAQDDNEHAHANVGKGVPCKTSFPPVEYSESEREESEYETDGEDIHNSPTNGREDELDEEDEEDPEEVIGDTSMSNENIEEQEHNRERKEIDEQSPSPRKQPLNRRKAVIFDSDDGE
ncbi:hypothetical protein ABZP36_018228 [Zizania latifolia]